jgi:hypothetical protein
MEVLILVLPAKHADDDDVFVLKTMVGWQTSKEGNNLIRYFLGQADNTCQICRDRLITKKGFGQLLIWRF